MPKDDQPSEDKSATNSVEEAKPICGIVMPISEIDGCSSAHWKDVLGIIREAAKTAGYEAKLVSESDDVGVIQQRIVQNLYDCEIVVCDVSAKNANVMFELGLRLAFDKPAIVLKDDRTSYSFDTSPIEHLEYPRDLRYSVIQSFKTDLASKITATVKMSKDPDYTTFLKHFGKFSVKGLATEEIDKDDFVMREISEIKSSLAEVSRQMIRSNRSDPIQDRPSPREAIRNLLFDLWLEGRVSKDQLADGGHELCQIVFDQDSSIVDACAGPGEYEHLVRLESKKLLKNIIKA